MQTRQRRVTQSLEPQMNEQHRFCSATAWAVCLLFWPLESKHVSSTIHCHCCFNSQLSFKYLNNRSLAFLQLLFPVSCVLFCTSMLYLVSFSFGLVWILSSFVHLKHFILPWCWKAFSQDIEFQFWVFFFQGFRCCFPSFLLALSLMRNLLLTFCFSVPNVVQILELFCLLLVMRNLVMKYLSVVLDSSSLLDLQVDSFHYILKKLYHSLNLFLSCLSILFFRGPLTHIRTLEIPKYFIFI